MRTFFEMYIIKISLIIFLANTQISTVGFFSLPRAVGLKIELGKLKVIIDRSFIYH